jgi:deazaflavin-dependent oxidoreductase (nitroreductase family)
LPSLPKEEVVTGANEWNRAIINEFRANGGKVGGQFAGAPLLLLHSTGAKSGQERINPMMYQDLDGRYAVFASNAGAQRHPAWFHNLMANPRAEVEIGTRTERVTARVAEGAERDGIWVRQKHDYPGFAHYEEKTDRQIPVVILEPDA